MSLTSVTLAALGDAAEMLPATRDHSLMTVLLILVLSLALVLGLVTLMMALHFLRSNRLERQRELQQNRLFPRERRFHSTILSVPSRWLAVRSDDPHAVQAALGLLKARRCSWEEGLSAAHEQKLFISPPVDGWVLVMGFSLPEPAHDVDKCFHFIVALSRKLGRVQFFSANRAAHHHAWVEADQGRIHRAYAWAGQTLWNQGRMTKAELDLGLKCCDYGELTGQLSFSQINLFARNTERVSLLASRWSVDPDSLGARASREAQGIAGELARARKS